MIFEVPGPSFGGRNRYKMASDCILERLEWSWRHPKGSWSGFGLSWARLGGQNAPEMEAKRVHNGVEEATRKENAISSKTIVFSMKFNDF